MINLKDMFCYFLVNLPKYVGLGVCCYAFVYPIETGRMLELSTLVVLTIIAVLCFILYGKFIKWYLRVSKEGKDE